MFRIAQIGGCKFNLRIMPMEPDTIARADLLSRQVSQRLRHLAPRQQASDRALHPDHGDFFKPLFERGCLQLLGHLAHDVFAD